MPEDFTEQQHEQVNPQTGNEGGSETTSEDAARRAIALEEVLRKERQAAKEASKKAEKLENELKQLKEKFDPEKYRILEEQELARKQQFEQISQRQKAELDETRKQKQTLEEQLTNLKIETAVKNAFYKAGGRDELLNPSDIEDDISPSDTVLTLLKNRIKVSEQGELILVDKLGRVEVGKDGRPKTLIEEMQRLRKGSLAGLFYPENTNEGMGSVQSVTADGKPIRSYSREAAKMGKADIEAIAKGKAQIR